MDTTTPLRAPHPDRWAKPKMAAFLREFAAKEDQPLKNFLAAEDAEKGMAEMSEKFREAGNEIYLPAAET